MYRVTDAQKAKVKDLLSRMTLEEKIGQMNQESVSIVGGFDVPFSAAVTAAARPEGPAATIQTSAFKISIEILLTPTDRASAAPSGWGSGPGRQPWS